jgi:hypothetical protein
VGEELEGGSWRVEGQGGVRGVRGGGGVEEG